MWPQRKIKAKERKLQEDKCYVSIRKKVLTVGWLGMDGAAR